MSNTALFDQSRGNFLSEAGELYFSAVYSEVLKLFTQGLALDAPSHEVAHTIMRVVHLIESQYMVYLTTLTEDVSVVKAA